MSTSTLHVSDARRDMLTAMFAAIDAFDVDALLAYLAPDATQQFGNHEPLRGTDEIRAGNLAFFSSIGGLSHELVDAWESHGTVLIRLQVTYTRLDGGVVTIPVMTKVHEDGDGLVDTYEVFADMAPVFAPAA